MVKNQRNSCGHMGCPPMFVHLHFHRGYSLGPQKSKPLIIYGIVSFSLCGLFSCRYNSPSVQQRLEGGRSAVRCRHGQKGGGRRGRWDGGHGSWLLLQRDDDGDRVGLRDAEPLGQGGEGAGGGMAEGTERRQQHGQEDVKPL